MSFFILFFSIAKTKLYLPFRMMKNEDDGSEEMSFLLDFTLEARQLTGAYLWLQWIVGMVYIFWQAPIMHKILFIPSIALFFIQVFKLLSLVPLFKKYRYFCAPIITTLIVGILLTVIGFVALWRFYPEEGAFFLNYVLRGRK